MVTTISVRSILIFFSGVWLFFATFLFGEPLYEHYHSLWHLGVATGSILSAQQGYKRDGKGHAYNTGMTTSYKFTALDGQEYFGEGDGGGGKREQPIQIYYDLNKPSLSGFRDPREKNVTPLIWMTFIALVAPFVIGYLVLKLSQFSPETTPGSEPNKQEAQQDA